MPSPTRSEFPKGKARSSHRGGLSPAIGLGSAGAALLMVVLVVIMLAGAASSVPNREVVQFLLLITVGFAAATGARNAETRLRRYSVHQGWRRTAVGYLVVVSTLTVTGPLALAWSTSSWGDLNRVLADLGPPNNEPTGASLVLTSAPSGSVFVLATAGACVSSLWLATAWRQRITSAKRPMLVLAVAIAFVALPVLIDQVATGTASPDSARLSLFAGVSLNDLPPLEAVFIGMAAALVPRTLIHRHPPHRLGVPAGLGVAASIIVPADGSLMTQTLAVAVGAASIMVLLTVGRLGMLPTPNFVVRLQRQDHLADNMMPLLPAFVAWHSVFLAIIVGRAELGRMVDQGLWFKIVVASASITIALAAATITDRRLVKPVVAWLSTQPTGGQTTRWPSLRTQVAILQSARFESPPSQKWDDHVAESVGRPLPARPTVPIRTSTIIHSGGVGKRIGRGAHRYRPPNRDQVPPPQRLTNTTQTSGELSRN